MERIVTDPDPYEPFLLSQGIRAGFSPNAMIEIAAVAVAAADPSGAG